MNFKNYIPSECRSSVEKILPVIRAVFSGFDGRDDALQDVDWSYIARFAERQRILPILYYNLRKSGLIGLLPESERSILQRRYTQIAGNNLRMSHRLTDLCGLFEKAGIMVVPYKGPVLSQMLYGDCALRFCQDLDMLVPHDRLKDVWYLLHEAGYRPAELPFIGQKGFLKFARNGNEFSFTDGSGVAIDLHWKIAKHTKCAFDVDFCTDRLKQIELNNRSLWRLSDEDMILALCLNGGGDLWPHLESVLVLADILAGSPDLDWDLLERLARRLRCERELLLGLSLAADIFEADLPETICRFLVADKALPGLVDRVYQGMFQTYSRDRVSHLFWQVRLRGHRADRIRYLLRRFFIPTKKDWSAWDVNRQNVLPLAFLRQVGYMRERWRNS